MARLTEGQRKARAAIKAAAKELIAEVDASPWRKDCVDFIADFHLGCWRYDKAVAFGQPAASGLPLYSRKRA